MRLLAPQLVDQHLATCSGEDSTDHVGVDDVREGVALFGEMTDVIPDGLATLLIAALEVTRVAWADVLPWKLPTNLFRRSAQPPIEWAVKNSSQARTLSHKQMGRY